MAMPDPFTEPISGDATGEADGPRLLAISGPHTGANVPLGDEEFSIGRDTSNSLSLEDTSVSRCHCVIRKESGQFRIRDLNSYNGTFVNDLPVTERLLEHGDQIKLGKSSFLFLQRQVESLEELNRVQIDERDLVTRSVIEFRPEDAPSSIARDLNTLLELARTLSSISDLDHLQRQLLEPIFKVVPAERGAVIFVEEGSGEPVSSFALNRSSGVERAVQVSRTVLRRVVQEKTAILSNELMESDELGGARSLIASGIRALICVPLTLYGRVLGVLYLDSSHPSITFNEGQLQLITGIAGLAAVALENARRMRWLEEENRRLETEVRIEHGIVGKSGPMQAVYQMIAKVAPADSTVLILGESGTGKELAARAIHRQSKRAQKPFVAINCAALTDTLLESELFGHEKGAFTGATTQKKGKLEIADGGTIFLDEVGELASLLQAKLLRVLQEREFERVGGTRPLKVNIRLLAATNRDLEEAVKSGRFRDDLFYRLNVVSLTMPPLRERREDISLLANYFTDKYAKKCQRRVSGISAEARACLMNYDWPGNVRELENAIERAVVLGSTETILPEDLPEAVLEREPPSGKPQLGEYNAAVKEAKKQLVQRAMEQASGSYAEAARLLGIHPNNLHRLIRNLNLKDTLKKFNGQAQE